MSDYQPPLQHMRFILDGVAGLENILQLPDFSDIDADVVTQVLTEAGRFAGDVLAPLNRSGDQEGCRIEDGAVVVAGGFGDAYARFVENGWQTLPAPTTFGGMGLPESVSVAAQEMWQSANLAFSLCPMLTAGSIIAIDRHGDPALKNLLLPKLVSGEWAGTMVLTEPQAGSDLAALTARAEPDGDHYRLTGTKIFITWGDHPMAENIIHLVLARLPDAPPGVGGISMFAVPKFVPNADGSIGERNDVVAASLEHKLGIHASPTCVMNFGEAGGALAYLVGEPNRGLACMFTMMNHARLNVGVQGLAVSERAYQLAATYAKERVQGRVPGEKGRVTIIHHPDVRRMLLVMKSQIEAMRAAAYWTASQIDIEQCATDENARREAGAIVGLLTPVIKGWMTETSNEITSLGLQVHGGMGYVEETGAAQLMRDARILTIYEGTTGIQANDLVGRKIIGDGGTAFAVLESRLAATAAALEKQERTRSLAAPLRHAAGQLADGVNWLLNNAESDPFAPGSSSVNLLMLTGTVVGAWQLARSLAAGEQVAADGDYSGARFRIAAFYFAHVLPRADAYARAACAATETIMGMPEDGF